MTAGSGTRKSPLAHRPLKLGAIYLDLSCFSPLSWRGPTHPPHSRNPSINRTLRRRCLKGGLKKTRCSTSLDFQPAEPRIPISPAETRSSRALSERLGEHRLILSRHVSRRKGAPEKVSNVFHSLCGNYNSGMARTPLKALESPTYPPFSCSSRGRAP